MLDAPPPRWLDLLKSLPLYVLPHHAVSRVVHWLARLETPFKNPVVRWFIRRYGVNMGEAAEPRPEAYASFNAAEDVQIGPGVDESDIVAHPQ